MVQSLLIYILAFKTKTKIPKNTLMNERILLKGWKVTAFVEKKIENIELHGKGWFFIDFNSFIEG